MEEEVGCEISNSGSTTNRMYVSGGGESVCVCVTISIHSAAAALIPLAPLSGGANGSPLIYQPLGWIYLSDGGLLLF